jgi:Zn finger protein HypA/HybF involved in hydrogenase expression
MKDEKEKEFICRQCSIFLYATELQAVKCPSCRNDEDVFINEQELQDEIDKDYEDWMGCPAN